MPWITEDSGKRMLTWGVCEQPWSAGDLLMLRKAEAGRTSPAQDYPLTTP